jgi:hypothetical protein
MFNDPSIYQWNKPTALMLGVFDNFSYDNVNQVKQSIKNIGQVCIQVRGSDTNTYCTKKDRIIDKLNESGISYNAKYIIIEVPNITDVII